MELCLVLAFLSALTSVLPAFHTYKLDVRKELTSFLPVKLAAGISAGSPDRVQDERKLIAALQKAGEANRAKTEFLANMSHDLPDFSWAGAGMLSMAPDLCNIKP